MDPSIMKKLLEDDEDENMHSAEELEAIQAALSRDIEGDVPASQPSDSDSAFLSQGSNNTSSQSFPQLSTASQDENTAGQIQQDQNVSQHGEQRTYEMELKQQESFTEIVQQNNDAEFHWPQKQPHGDLQQGQEEQKLFQVPETSGMPASGKIPSSTQEQGIKTNIKRESQSSPQSMITEQPMNMLNGSQMVPFIQLLPFLMPQLDEDKGKQLTALFDTRKRNEITNTGFVRKLKLIVGDEMIKMAVTKVHPLAENPHMKPLQPKPKHKLQPEASVQQQTPRMLFLSEGSTQLTDPHSHLRRENSPTVPTHIPPSTVHVQTDSSHPVIENSARKFQEAEFYSDSHGMQVSQLPSSSVVASNHEKECSSVPVQVLNKPQQQKLHHPPSSFTMHENTGGTSHQYSEENANTCTLPVKPQPPDARLRQIPQHQSSGSAQSGGEAHGANIMSVPNSQGLPSSALVEQGNASSGISKDRSIEKQLSRMGVSASSMALSSCTSAVPSNSVSPSFTMQVNPSVSFGPQKPSRTSPSGINHKTPPNKPCVGQKKPHEALVTSPPQSSKKQKVSGGFSDIEQLNDVTAVSGVNLREEEEQLFSGPIVCSRASGACRKAVQEEEERLILQKAPLKKKLAKIMVKCGLKGVTHDVERCLSLCVEERLRGLINNLIRLSKQRVDAEKSGHHIIATFDVGQQIMDLNRKAKEEWERKQAEEEKCSRLNEPEVDNGVNGDKGEDEGHPKSSQTNKEEHEKMRTTAANVAARAAVGGDDMFSRWQLMAQSRKEREGEIDAASGSHPGKDINCKHTSTAERIIKDHEEAEKSGGSAPVAAAGTIRKSGRNRVVIPQTRIGRTISVRDAIAVLEREPQMSKSILIYRLHERIQSDTAGKIILK